MAARTLASIVVAMLLGSCVDVAKYQAEHRQRVTEIDSRYARVRSRIRAHWHDVLAPARELRSHLIAIEPGSHYEPANRVEDQRQLVDMQAQCSAISEDDTTANDVLEACDARYEAEYKALLRFRYFRADEAWVDEQRSADGNADIESLYAYSHNTILLAHITPFETRVEASLRDSLAMVAQMRKQEIASRSSAARPTSRTRASASTSRPLPSAGRCRPWQQGCSRRSNSIRALARVSTPTIVGATSIAARSDGV